MAFQTNQIYTLVNEAVSQALGSTEISVLDAQSLVTTGNIVLNSNDNTESFLNVLPQRIGKTIFSYRAYYHMLMDMVRSDFEWGAILQKINVDLVDAIADPSYNLQNGQSYDQWKVYKPNVYQKLFVSRTPYVYPITVGRKQLKEAFLSESAMGQFISIIFGSVRNSIELGIENLGRVTLANFIAETAGTDREIKLLTMYNTETGASLTAGQAVRNEDFLRFAIEQIKIYSKRLTDMSVKFNAEGKKRFTPFDLQRIRIFSPFQTRLETSVLYSAFHDGYVSLTGYSEMNFFQSEDTPDQVIVTTTSGKEVTVSNIVGVIYDHEALGIYQEDEDVLTTPVNALARYYNTFYHLKQMWFNDQSENFLLFTLN